MDTLEKVKGFFAKDIYATNTTGIEIITAKENYAKCMFEIKPHHLNAGGGVMGGALYTIADFTFAIGANFNKPTTLSLNGNINYLNKAKGKIIYAEAKCIKDGKSTCVFEVEVYDDLGTKVAFVSFTGIRVG